MARLRDLRASVTSVLKNDLDAPQRYSVITAFGGAII
jgi:hypothetical protein